jgi:hypothetical protein
MVKQNLFIILDDVQNLKVIEQFQFCDKGVKYSMNFLMHEMGLELMYPYDS